MSKTGLGITMLLGIAALIGIIAFTGFNSKLSILENCESVPVENIDGGAVTSYDQLRDLASISASEWSDDRLEEAGYSLKDGKMYVCAETVILE